MQILPPGSAPYIAPYAVFLALSELGRRVPELAVLCFVLRVLAPAALLVWYARRGAYPELRGYRIGPGAIADGVVGAAIALLWLTPYVVFPALPRGEPFDRSILGEGREGLTLALRLAGFGLVTPFMEELFVRSFLLRFAEVITEGDFRALPIARFATRGFVVTVLWFTFSHQPWEWLVALPTGIALNAWLYARRHLGACVVAHAVANASIWAVVVFGERALWEFL